MKKALFLKFNILFLLAIFVITTGFSCKVLSPNQKELLQPVTINWWGTFDDPGNFYEIFEAYRRIHPNISIKYRKLRPEEFENELLNALAEDRGPDIFSIRNTEIGKWKTKIEPLPPTTKLAYQVIKKSLGLKEDILIEVRENNSLTPGQIKEFFIDTVYNDVVQEGKVYGLPVSVDTLVMIYNRDLFNNAKIPLPPRTWVELQSYVNKLTFQDLEGNLIQSGVAMGTAKNVDHSFDIVSLLMMQNGAQMMNGRKVGFSQTPVGSDFTYNPGPEALRYYVDFATPSKEVYTWDETFQNSIDSFVQGKVAIVFGYSSDLEYIELTREGKLNYGIAKVPQIDGRPETNISNYWIQTVSKKSKNINEAWDFVQFMSQKDQAEQYLDKTNRSTALRSLVTDQLSDEQVSIFAEQLLTSTSWYTGNNYSAAVNAFSEMIEAVTFSGISPVEAANTAAKKIQQTL